jgi:hypothetical protein
MNKKTTKPVVKPKRAPNAKEDDDFEAVRQLVTAPQERELVVSSKSRRIKKARADAQAAEINS